MKSLNLIWFLNYISCWLPLLLLPYIWAWEWGLGFELSTAQLTHLYQLTHSSSIDSKTRENFKILSCWYWVPTDLARIYPSTPEQCWRGCTLLHLWWEWPVIIPFWADIKDQIKDILGLDIPLSHFIFSCISIPYRLVSIRKVHCLIYWTQQSICFQFTGSVHKFLAGRSGSTKWMKSGKLKIA